MDNHDKQSGDHVPIFIVMVFHQMFTEIYAVVFQWTMIKALSTALLLIVKAP